MVEMEAYFIYLLSLLFGLLSLTVILNFAGRIKEPLAILTLLDLFFPPKSIVKIDVFVAITDVVFLPSFAPLSCFGTVHLIPSCNLLRYCSCCKRNTSTKMLHSWTSMLDHCS